jgi:hypothetical protein
MNGADLVDKLAEMRHRLVCLKSAPDAVASLVRFWHLTDVVGDAQHVTSQIRTLMSANDGPSLVFRLSVRSLEAQKSMDSKTRVPTDGFREFDSCNPTAR